jgi:hypothetical protein
LRPLFIFFYYFLGVPEVDAIFIHLILHCAGCGARL